MTGNDLAVFGDPQIKLNLLCAHSHSRTEGRHTVFRGNGVKASVGTEPRIRHTVIRSYNGTAGWTVFPGTAALFNIFIVCSIRIAKACRLIVFLCNIHINGFNTYAAAHIAEDLARRRNHHTCATDVGIHIHGYRGADHIGVGIVRQKLVHDLQCFVGIASLMGAGNDHIQILPCKVRKSLIEIGIIANKESKANAFYFDYGRFGKLKRIIAIELHHRYFAGG